MKRALSALGALVAAGLIAWLVLRDPVAVPPPAPPPSPVSAPATMPAASPTPTPPAATPGPLLTPAIVEHYEVVWRRSGEPVTDVVARVAAAGADGREVLLHGKPLPPDFFANATVRFHDLATSLALATFTAPPRTARLRLPEPIRLVGTIHDDANRPASLASVRLGQGDLELPGDRFRRITHSELRRAPDEDAPWGIPLKPTPTHWATVPVDRDANFQTGWFVADRAPKLFVWDSDGRVHIEEVAFPATLRPREDLRLDVRLLPPTGLEIEIDYPPGHEGFPIAIGLATATPAPQWLDHSAFVLSVLDVMHTDVGRFATGHGNVFVTRSGARRFAPMPVLQSATLVARGATTALVPQREIAIPFGTITRVRFSREELFPEVRRWVRLEGRVQLEETGRPVPGARLVASWLAERHETETDADGRFVFPRVAADQELVLYLEAYDEQDTPRWSHSATRDFDGLADDPTVLEWEIPGMYWMQLLGTESRDREIPYVTLLRLDNETGEFAPFTGNAEYYLPPGFVEIELPAPGTWKALAQVSDFVMAESEIAHFDEFGEDQVVRLLAPTGITDRAQVRVMTPRGTPAAGVTAYLVAPFPGLRRIEFTTDRSGAFTFGPYNIPSIGIRIESTLGHYEGYLDMVGSDHLVILQATEY